MDEEWINRLRLKLGIVPNINPANGNIMLPSKTAEAEPPLAASSCGFPAGSIEKIEVMRQRTERGEAIFHPNDNKTVLYKFGQ